jgi:hypothetical protein
MKYRTGRKNGHTIYLQLGAKPSDKDQFVGSCVGPKSAAKLVELANRGIETAPPEEGEEG